ncbi:hypothetical protein Tco_0286578 [Tanacetum coccineum]
MACGLMGWGDWCGGGVSEFGVWVELGGCGVFDWVCCGCGGSVVVGRLGLRCRGGVVVLGGVGGGVELGVIIQVPSSNMAKQNVTKLPYWSILDKGITRGFKEAHIDKGFYTKLLARETQKGSDTRMPRWQSVCPKINPTVKNKDLMIEMKEGCGFKERLTNSGA